MFEAVRSRLVSAWKDLHARGLPSLFVFELFVVTLGVLLAQGIADWSGDRAARKRLDVSLARMDRDIESNMHSAEAWQMAISCFRERLDTIMILAAQGAPIELELLQRPGLRGFRTESLSTDAVDLLHAAGRSEEAVLYTSLARYAGSASNSVTDVGDNWLTLAVLDPRLGPIAAADRTNARRDAARMLSAIRRIEVVSKGLLGEGAQLGLHPRADQDARTARDCAEIWERSDMTPDPREDP